LSKTKLNLNKYGWKVLAYLIGLAIVMLIYAIPFVGWVAQFAGILFGFGGLVMLLKDWIWGFNKAKNTI
jgi:predicted tellurium resistance membrane protein TerC